MWKTPVRYRGTVLTSSAFATNTRPGAVGSTHVTIVLFWDLLGGFRGALAFVAALVDGGDGIEVGIAGLNIGVAERG
jgi:hypothetical protein